MTEQTDAQANDDFDSPWKEVLEYAFEDFLHFFFPEAAVGIDWGKGHRFLDKELQQVSRDGELGRRYADKLVQVYRKDGEEVWVLIIMTDLWSVLRCWADQWEEWRPI